MCANRFWHGHSIWDASNQLSKTPDDFVKNSIPWLISLVLVIWVISKMMPHKQAPGLDIDGFSRLPVLVGGRVMPMDTLARISLSVMNHHGTFTVDGKVEPASRWLLDVFMMPRACGCGKGF